MSSQNKSKQIQAKNLKSVRKKTTELIKEAVRSEDSILVEAPPSSGKTTSVFKVADETGIPITYLTKRHDLYDEAEKNCENLGLDSWRVPAPHRNCPAFDESNQQYHAEAVSLYDLGIGAAKIHEKLSLPCSSNCDYMKKWDSFAPKKTDVVIGNYLHAFIDSVIDDRVVVFDEFPGQAFEKEFTNADEVVTNFLRKEDEIPFQDFLDLFDGRNNTDQVSELYAWIKNNGGGIKSDEIINVGASKLTLLPLPFHFQMILRWNEKDGASFIEVEMKLPFSHGQILVMQRTLSALTEHQHQNFGNWLQVRISIISRC